MSENHTNYGNLRIASSTTTAVKGIFLGDGNNVDTKFDARASAEADWPDDSITGTLMYSNIFAPTPNAGASTLWFTEEGAGGPHNKSQMNIRVRGIAEPVDDQDAVNKKYVDEALQGVVNIHANVIQRTSTQVTNLANFAYNGGVVPATMTFTVPNSSPWSFTHIGGTDGSVNYDTVTTIATGQVTQRVVFTNNGGAGAHVSNGVYVLSTINAAGLAVWSRTDDLDVPDDLRKGEMVLVYTPSGHRGVSADQNIAYVLQSAVADLTTTPQDWKKSTAQGVQSFADILHNDADTVRCRGNNSNDDDSGKPVVGAAVGTNGLAVIQANDLSAVGKAGNNFEINGTGFTSTFAGNSTIDSDTSFHLNAQASLLTVNASELITFRCDGNAASNFKSVGATHTFAFAPGGTPVIDTSELPFSDISAKGVILPLTDILTDGGGGADTGRVGGGVFFDSASVMPGANGNANKFLIAPKTQDNTANKPQLAIIGFNNDNSSKVLATFAVS